MRIATVASFVVAAVGAAALSAVFVQNASPYVTIDQALTAKNEVHVVGELVPGTLQQQSLSKEVRFDLKDGGGTMHVLYTGPAQPNLAQAKQIVVIGSLKDGLFTSEKMLVKCPSKYESKKTAS